MDPGEMRYRKCCECRGKQSCQDRATGMALGIGQSRFLHFLSTATRKLLKDSNHDSIRIDVRTPFHAVRFQL